MKRIDIHTRKEINDEEMRSSESISPDEMKDYVYSQIDFMLSELQWTLIDEFFSDYWNNIIGIGGYFYHDEVSAYIFNKIIERKQLISKERITFIVELMLSKIEEDGGFIE